MLDAEEHVRLERDIETMAGDNMAASNELLRGVMLRYVRSKEVKCEEKLGPYIQSEFMLALCQTSYFLFASISIFSISRRHVSKVQRVLPILAVFKILKSLMCVYQHNLCPWLTPEEILGQGYARAM
jgi:hypothetical protein